MLNNRLPLLIIGAVLLTVLIAHPVPAAAGSGHSTDDKITVEDSSPGAPGGGGTDSTPGGRTGKWLECGTESLTTDPQAAIDAGHEGQTQWLCRLVNADGSDAGAYSIIWSATNPAIADPETIAQQIVTSMNLGALPLSMIPEDGPGVYGLVGLPVWFWTPASGWAPRESSKTSGALSVSVTAKVDRVVIRTGDGRTVTCMGPGTKYELSYGIAKSPDCGHVYEKTSGAGRKYSITATTYWKAQWSAGAASGVIDIDASTTARLAIGEAQALRQ